MATLFFALRSWLTYLFLLWLLEGPPAAHVFEQGQARVSIASQICKTFRNAALFFLRTSLPLRLCHVSTACTMLVLGILEATWRSPGSWSLETWVALLLIERLCIFATNNHASTSSRFRLGDFAIILRPILMSVDEIEGSCGFSSCPSRAVLPFVGQKRTCSRSSLPKYNKTLQNNRSWADDFGGFVCEIWWAGHSSLWMRNIGHCSGVALRIRTSWKR